VVLHQPGGLAQDRAADAVGLAELRLRPEQLADRPAPAHDVLLDLARHLLRELGTGDGHGGGHRLGHRRA
jgi:hypothetical protein